MILRVPLNTVEVIRAWMQTLVADPPTASEEAARIQVVKLLWIIYEEDPVAFPDGPLKDVWGMMYGAPHDELIAAGVAAMWP